MKHGILTFVLSPNMSQIFSSHIVCVLVTESPIHARIFGWYYKPGWIDLGIPIKDLQHNYLDVRWMWSIAYTTYEN
jgi:hypothetical protein